jgi:hypothetical protein
MIQDYWSQLQQKLHNLRSRSSVATGRRPGKPTDPDTGLDKRLVEGLDKGLDINTKIADSDDSRRDRLDRSTDANAETHRGWYGYMQYINASIGCLFIVIALLYALHPNPLAWAPYSAAAVLSLITLKSEISIAFSRVLAISTTALMFFFFAGFFLLVPKLAADWYAHQAGWEAVFRIFGAFAMIPILSDYSCRLKAECAEARLHARRAFFSAPDHVRPNN